MIICEPIIGCCTEFWVEVPPDYLEAVIGIRITKGNGTSIHKNIVIQDGLVQIPLEDLPQDWLNPYGGPYTLQYIDFLTEEAISFTYKGESVSGVEWNMAPGLSDITICTLNIFQ